MRVDRLEQAEGERSVRIAWAGGETRLRIGVPAELAPTGDDLTAFVPVALLLAMRRGEPLEVDGPVASGLLGGLAEAQEALSAWGPTFTRVPVRVVASVDDAPLAAGRACCLSCGVDSLFSAAWPRRPGDELTHLVYVEGFDPSYGEATRPARQQRARAAAARIGLPLIVATTNLPEVIDHAVDFEDAFGAALAAVGLSLGRVVDRFVIPSSRDYGGMLPIGSHPLLDARWSSNAVAIEHDSVALNRPDKVRWLVEQRPDLLPLIYVCWGADSGENCGRCAKCMFTAVLLEIAGGLADAGSFPPELDLDRLAEVGLPALITRLGLNDTYRAVPPEPRFDAIRSTLAELLRRSTNLPVDDSPHGISRHQDRLFRALLEGRPYPPSASGPRLPEPVVGPLPPYSDASAR